MSCRPPHRRGALAVMLAITIGLPRRPPLLLLLPLVGLWLWSLLSSGWSDSSDGAVLAADRWLLYAAALVLLGWLVGGDRRLPVVLLGGVSAGVLGIGAWMLARMLAGHGPALFIGTRLNDPLGYVNGQAGYLLVGLWPCLALAERRGSRGAAPLAGAGMAGVVVLIALGLLTRSRSWGIALVGSALLLLVLVPGRSRRAAALLVGGLATAAISSSLSSVWRSPSPLSQAPTVASTRHAALAVLLAGVVSGVGGLPL